MPVIVNAEFRLGQGPKDRLVGFDTDTDADSDTEADANLDDDGISLRVSEVVCATKGQVLWQLPDTDGITRR